jgi:hypothetical protein
MVTNAERWRGSCRRLGGGRDGVDDSHCEQCGRLTSSLHPTTFVAVLCCSCWSNYAIISGEVASRNLSSSRPSSPLLRRP